MTGKLQVVAILTRIKYRARCYRIAEARGRRRIFSRQEMILFILLTLSAVLFSFTALKIVCVFIFQGKFY